jgi:hypothetical protein
MQVKEESRDEDTDRPFLHHQVSQIGDSMPGFLPVSL